MIDRKKPFYDCAGLTISLRDGQKPARFSIDGWRDEAPRELRGKGGIQLRAAVPGFNPSGPFFFRRFFRKRNERDEAPRDLRGKGGIQLRAAVMGFNPSAFLFFRRFFTKGKMMESIMGPNDVTCSADTAATVDDGPGANTVTADNS